MYNRILNFFYDSNSIYLLPFGFKQKYYTITSLTAHALTNSPHALTSLTEDIRKKSR